MNPVLLSVGSNLGDRRSFLSEGARMLAELGTVVRKSGIYSTSPVDVLDQPEFLNAAILLDTDRSPEDLLPALKEIERALGGPRTAGKGPRHFDVDIIFFGQTVLRTPRLVIPHPAWRDRRFVVEPLVEIAPDFPVPPEGRSLRETTLDLRFPGQEAVRLDLDW